VEFRILGPLEVVADERTLAIPSGQQRALLALLVLNANRVLSPDRIADALWGDRLPDSGTKALAFHVSRLRDALAPGRAPGGPAGGLETVPGGYVLRTDPDAIDAVRFERLAREGHALLAADPAGARDLIRDALAVWRGDPLADVAYAEFAQEEIRRLIELRAAATEDRLEADIALGDHVGAVGELEAIVAADPLRERPRCLLVLALYRSGRQAEALRVAGEGRRALAEEFGIDPSPELRQLEARILVQDPALDPPPPRPGATAGRARNPYKGLRPYGEADSADFFGREALVDRLVARFDEVERSGRLLAVVGPSGSGKSSVVRAGLLPALRAAGAPAGRPAVVATMVPGVAPVRELAAALAAAGLPVDVASIPAAERTGDVRGLVAGALLAGTDGERPSSGRVSPSGPGPGPRRLVVVIDQLEELFVRADEMTRRRFLDGLADVLADRDLPVVVVATLRADFLHVPLALPRVGDLVRGGTELVTPLTRPELERAIVRPAGSVGAEVEPALVVEMIADVEARPGGLPLLEYALTELFERSDGRRLTREGYAAIGGVAGALGRRADEAWRSLDPDGREAARQILLAMVAVSESGVPTARRVARADLASLADEPGRVDAVLDAFGRCGLLTFDLDQVTGGPTVEVAHEALLAHWSRLADWVEDHRADLWTRLRLAYAANEWEAADRAPDFLAAGAKLDRFETWARGTRLRLTESERAFLQASAAERARLEAAEKARAARERRTERRARGFRAVLVGVVAAGLVLAGGLTAAIIVQRQAAVESEAIARARQLAAASLASRDRDLQLAILLALEAADATAGRGYVVEEVYDALQWALQDARARFPRDAPTGVRQSPDGPRGAFLVSPGEIVAMAAASVERSLTTEECRTYVGAEACATPSPPPTGTVLGVRTTAGVVEPTTLAFGPLEGTRVRVLSELPSDASPLLAAFSASSGITVGWDPAADGDLEAALAAGDVPDLAIVARPSLVAAEAREGGILDLDGLVDTSALTADAGPYLSALGVAAGPRNTGGLSGRYGVAVAAAESDLLWYPAAAFARAGYAPPTTPAELDALVARMRVDDRVPWCLGIEPGSHAGSEASAWVEGTVLAAEGPAAYDGWISGDLAFTSGPVRAAFEAVGRRLGAAGAVMNGLASAAYTPDRIAAWPMLAAHDPDCWLYRGASTDRPRFPPGTAGEASAVPFPGFTGASRPELGRTWMVVALRDRPEVRAVLAALVGTSTAGAMAAEMASDGILPVRATADPADPLALVEARRLHDALAAGTFRVRAVDLLPEPVATAFQDDVFGYLAMVPTEGPVQAQRDFGADAARDALRRLGAP
jgi:DNA-binding SARP family transcriptional activator